MLAREVSYALYGTWRLARMDPSGLVFFERSLEGFWRSWWSLAFIYPAGLVISGIHASPQWQEAGFLRVALLQAIGSVIGYALYPLIVLALTRFIDRSAQFFDYIVAYNWSQVPVSAAFLLLAGLGGSGILGETGWIASEAAILAGWCAYHAYLALVSLRAGAAPAAALVLVDMVLGIFISVAVDRLS
jgi:hypothetical protein